MNNLAKLYPTKLWQYLAQISAIPRKTHHEQQISAFMQKFSNDLGLECIIDEVGNVLIRKPASKEMENRQSIVLQAHLDMVAVKDNKIEHDFEKDPIQPFIDGDWVRAKGTTLGADDGVGVASIMAILESKNIKHGPIEALFTVSEEVGLAGALALQPNLLKSNMMLNLDHEIQNEICIGSASANRSTFQIKYQLEPIKNNFIGFKIELSGLLGGHSGTQIHLKRGNAIKILGALLLESTKKFGLRLNHIKGGIAHNVIPKEASAIVVIPANVVKEFHQFVKRFSEKYNAGIPLRDTKLTLTLTEIETPKQVIDLKTETNILTAICACANGVLAMSQEVPDLVETSSNLGMIQTTCDNIEILTMQRSMSNFWAKYTAKMVECIFEIIGAKIIRGIYYGSWEPNTNSPLLNLAKKTFTKKFGTEPIIKAVHAGLECGVFKLSYPDLDIIAFGPTIKEAHSTHERVSIESVGKYWDFLVALLEQI